MAQRRKLRTLLRIFRDRVSFIRASVSLNRAASTVHLAVLRATSVSSSSVPPSERRLSSVLRLGRGSRITACACVTALIDRLHSTADANVALKSLIIIHALVSRTSFILPDHLYFFPSSGGRNPLNLSSFRDDSDAETWELSSWVRWYAELLEQTLIASRSLGFTLFSSRSRGSSGEENTGKVSTSSSSSLIGEIGVLSRLIELISNSPESVHLQTNNLIYEVVRLVCEDYCIARSETSLRLVELGGRLDGLTNSELTELLGELDRLEGCKEKLLRLFGNRKNGYGMWDTVTHMKINVSAKKDQIEGWKLARKENPSGTSQFRGRVESVPMAMAISTVG